MIPKDAERLKVGQRVQWTMGRDTTLGTVTKRAPKFVEVAWDDGQTGALHTADCVALIALREGD